MEATTWICGSCGEGILIHVGEDTCPECGNDLVDDVWEPELTYDAPEEVYHDVHDDYRTGLIEARLEFERIESDV